MNFMKYLKDLIALSGLAVTLLIIASCKGGYG